MENQTTKTNNELEKKYPAAELKKYGTFNISNYIEVGDGIDASEVDEAGRELREARNIVLFDDFDLKDLNDYEEGNLRKISEIQLMFILLAREEKGTYSIEKHVNEDTGNGEYYVRYWSWGCKTKDLTYGHDTIYEALESFVKDYKPLIWEYEHGSYYDDFERWIIHNADINVKINYEGQDEDFVYFSSEEMDDDDDTN